MKKSILSFFILVYTVGVSTVVSAKGIDYESYFRDMTNANISIETDDLSYADLRLMSSDDIAKIFNVSLDSAEIISRLWRVLPENIDVMDSVELDDGVYTLLDQDDYNRQLWQFTNGEKTAVFECEGQLGKQESGKVVNFDPICFFYNTNK